MKCKLLTNKAYNLLNFFIEIKHSYKGKRRKAIFILRDFHILETFTEKMSKPLKEN